MSVTWCRKQRAGALCAGQLPVEDIKCTSSLSPGSNQRKQVLFIIPIVQRNQAQGSGGTCSWWQDSKLSL